MFDANVQRFLTSIETKKFLLTFFTVRTSNFLSSLRQLHTNVQSLAFFLLLFLGVWPKFFFSFFFIVEEKGEKCVSNRLNTEVHGRSLSVVVALICDDSYVVPNNRGRCTVESESSDSAPLDECALNVRARGETFALDSSSSVGSGLDAGFGRSGRKGTRAV